MASEIELVIGILRIHQADLKFYQDRGSVYAETVRQFGRISRELLEQIHHAAINAGAEVVAKSSTYGKWRFSKHQLGLKDPGLEREHSARGRTDVAHSMGQVDIEGIAQGPATPGEGCQATLAERAGNA